MTEIESIGPQLRILRVRARKKQKEVAAAVGLHPSKLCEIEAGKVDPRFSVVARIVAAIGADGADIIELFRAEHKDAA